MFDWREGVGAGKSLPRDCSQGRAGLGTGDRGLGMQDHDGGDLGAVSHTHTSQCVKWEGRYRGCGGVERSGGRDKSGAPAKPSPQPSGTYRRLRHPSRHPSRPSAPESAIRTRVGNLHPSRQSASESAIRTRVGHLHPSLHSASESAFCIRVGIPACGPAMRTDGPGLAPEADRPAAAGLGPRNRPATTTTRGNAVVRALVTASASGPGR